MSEGFVHFDPRALIAVLVAASFVAFMEKSLACEVSLLIVLALLQSVSGHWKMALGFVAGFGLLWLILNYAMPYLAVTPLGALTLSLTLARKIFFCAMAAALLVGECSVHRMSAALARMKMPRQILIPFSVTMRYFPALKDDIGHIRDAMSMRQMPFAARMEAVVVPVIVAATNTADELSRASVLRGIENPAAPSDTERLSMGPLDWMLVALSAVAVAAVFFVGGSY